MFVFLVGSRASPETDDGIGSESLGAQRHLSLESNARATEMQMQGG